MEKQTGALRELPVGGKLIVRCKLDWRSATVASHRGETVVLTISSPTGRTYRKSCPGETVIDFDGTIPLIGAGEWRENLARYDLRW